ncbi:MAG: hypothetical protein RhofKO_09500 [Rhodothermales bacterium]
MRYLLLGAGLFLIGACTSIDPTASPDTLYDDAMAAYEAGHPIDTYRLLHAASEAGSFDADFALAEFYATGALPHQHPAGYHKTSVPADRIIAFNSFWGGWNQDAERATHYQEQGTERVHALVAEGNHRAMTRLGVSLLYSPSPNPYGLDTPQDLARGHQLLADASAAGHAKASFSLWISSEMLGLDDSERLKYIARAEAQGHPHTFHLHVIELRQHDPLGALHHLDQRAQAGHAEAADLLANMLQSMRDVVDVHPEAAQAIAAWDARG